MISSKNESLVTPWKCDKCETTSHAQLLFQVCKNSYCFQISLVQINFDDSPANQLECGDMVELCFTTTLINEYCLQLLLRLISVANRNMYRIFTGIRFMRSTLAVEYGVSTSSWCPSRAYSLSSMPEEMRITQLWQSSHPYGFRS